MKCILLSIGKTSDSWLREGMTVYEKRIPHYMPFEYVEVPDVKNAGKKDRETLKKEEGQIILSHLQNTDRVILLDEGGGELSSRKFAAYFQHQMNSGVKRLVFVIGGAFGFSQELKTRANAEVSLSKMTFSHQMVRLIALEQIYRAMTILRGEPYHHD